MSCYRLRPCMRCETLLTRYLEEVFNITIIIVIIIINTIEFIKFWKWKRKTLRLKYIQRLRICRTLSFMNRLMKLSSYVVLSNCVTSSDHKSLTTDNIACFGLTMSIHTCPVCRNVISTSSVDAQWSNGFVVSCNSLEHTGHANALICYRGFRFVLRFQFAFFVIARPFFRLCFLTPRLA